MAWSSAARQSEAMASLARRSQWQEALQIFVSSERRFGLHLHSATTCLGILRRAPQCHWPSSLQLLQRCRDRRIALDVVCFSSLARSLEESALWQKTLLLLQDMDLQSIQPNAVTVTAVFRALGRSGQLHKTQQLAEQMERRRLVLDTLAYVALNFAHEQSSQWQLALALHNPTTSGYGVSLAACEKASLWREALQLIKDMRDRLVSVNEMMINSLLSTFSKTLKWSLAIRLLQGCQGANYDVVGMAALFSACEEGRGSPPLPTSTFRSQHWMRPFAAARPERLWGAEVTKIEELYSRGHLRASDTLAFCRGVFVPVIKQMTRSQPVQGQFVQEILDFGLSFTRVALAMSIHGKSGEPRMQQRKTPLPTPLTLLPVRPMRGTLPLEAHVLLFREDMYPRPLLQQVIQLP